MLCVFGKSFLRRGLSLFAQEAALAPDLSVRQDVTLVGKRIYIAGRFARRDQFAVIATELEAAGAQVTSRWLSTSDAPLQRHHLTPDSRGGEMAAMDFEDVRGSDICIAFTECPEAAQGRGGRHTELGIALALSLRVVIVGPREHVFHCLPEIQQFDTWEQARHELVAPTLAMHPEPIAAPFAAVAG